MLEEVRPQIEAAGLKLVVLKKHPQDNSESFDIVFEGLEGKNIGSLLKEKPSGKLAAEYLKWRKAGKFTQIQINRLILRTICVKSAEEIVRTLVKTR